VHHAKKQLCPGKRMSKQRPQAVRAAGSVPNGATHLGGTAPYGGTAGRAGAPESTTGRAATGPRAKPPSRSSGTA
jgi:hypothetical protein